MSNHKKKINKKEAKEEHVKKGVNKILVSLIALILLIGIYAVVVKFNKEEDNKRFSEEYTLVSEDNVFVYKEIDEVIEILESGTGVIYFGFPECKWCQAYTPILNEIAKEKGVKEISYINIREDRKENTKEYQKIVSILADFLDKDEEENPRIYVPAVVVVVDGKVLSHNNETALITENITPEDYWTTEKKENLEKTLSEMFSKLNICFDCND